MPTPGDAAALSPRQQSILCAVCREYVMHGRPVASQSLAQVRGIAWSSATIRNELAVLEKLGLLRQVHASGGRKPTNRGLERYVHTLSQQAAAPSAEHIRALDRSLVDVEHNPDRGLRAAVCVLSEAAGCVAVSFVGRPRDGVIRRLDLVPLVGSRGLVALEMDDGSVRTHAVDFALPTEAKGEGIAVTRLQERLRWLCEGRSLANARARLHELMVEEETRLDHMLEQALRLGLMLCAIASVEPSWVQIAGQRSLTKLGSSEPALREVLDLLEDYQRLAGVLWQVLPAPDSAAALLTAVHLGYDTLLGGPAADDGGRPPAMGGLSLVGCRTRAPNESTSHAALALLGSDRMDYAAAIPLLEYAAKTLAARMSA